MQEVNTLIYIIGKYSEQQLLKFI